jgi:HEAT repeat protein
MRVDNRKSLESAFQVKYIMPRSHLSLGKLRFVLMLLALAGPLLFTTWQAGAQKKKAAPRASATPAATPQTSTTQTAPKSQKINLVRMRSSDTSDGSSVSLESDGVMNKYSAYRKEDRFYVVVPELDAQRAQSNLRGRGFQNVQVQKNGNETVRVFRLQPGAKASVRQRFNRLDVVFSTPGGAGAATGANPDGNSQTQSTQTGTQSNTRTPSTQTQSGTTTAPNSARPIGVDTNPSTTTNQTPVVTPYIPGPAPATTEPTPAGAQPATPVESPAANADATPPPDQIAQVQNSPVSQQPTSISQQPLTTNPSLATTLARNWWLALVVGLVLISLGLVVAARAKSRRSQTDEKVIETESRIEEKPAKVTATPKLKAVPVETATTAAVVAAAAKKSDKEKAVASEKKDESKAESAFKESPVKEIIAADKSATRDAAPVTTRDIESASMEVRKLLAGEAYDEAIVGSSERGTRQAVAAELLAALAARNVERRERAREAFVKHNYVDEATHDLRTADAAGERASAARALGLSQDKTATPHLIAALEDDSPEVRRAVIEAMAELRDPVAVAPLEALLKSEHDRKVPHSLIRRAIEVSAVVAAASIATDEKDETTTIEAVAPIVDAQDETLETAAPAVEEDAKAVSVVKDETQTIEASPVEAAPLADEAGKPAATETAHVVSEASQLSLSDAPAVETSSNVFVPPIVDATAQPQRSDNRKKRKKQARLKKAEEQTRKLAELEAARQKEQELAARAAAEAEAARLLAAEQERERAREEEARRQAEEEQRRQAEEEQRRLEAEAARKAQEEAAAREQAEAEARRQAEVEAQRKAEEEAARLRIEEEARAHAEEEARLRAQVEERQRVEAEARQKADAEATRLQAEEEQRRQAEEQRRQEEEQHRQAEEARRRAEAEQRAQAEAARIEAEAAAAKLRAVEEARRQAEEEERRRVEEDHRRAEEERRRVEAEAARKHAEEEEARVRAEAEARAEEEARRQAEARLRAEEEAARQREAQAARERAEEEARQRAEEEAARLRAEEEARQRREEEDARRAAEEAETIHVLEADVITGSEPASLDELLIERNDGSNVGWFDIDVSQTDVSSSSTTPIELSSVTDSPDVMDATAESSITEWHMTQPVTHETAGAASIELAEEATLEAPKEIAVEAPRGIDVSVAEKGIAEHDDEFSTVPNSILRRLGSEEWGERAEAVADLGRLGGEDAFREISAAFDDPVQEVRNAAARTLYDLSADRAASFTRALREAPMERRRSIGSALASSGLAGEAIGHLMGESREKTYDAFSLLFLMSKAGEVQPLMRAIEEHPNNEVRLAVVKLLALSGQQEILPAFRRLAVRGSLPTEVRSAVMEAIYQISSQSPSDASSRV